MSAPGLFKWFNFGCVAATVLLLGGCARYDKDLVATWYLVHQDQKTPSDVAPRSLAELAAEAQLDEIPKLGRSDPPEIKDIYVVIINQGRQAKQVHRVLLNASKKSKDFLPGKILFPKDVTTSSGKFRKLAPGDTWVLPAELTIGAGKERTLKCELPVHLRVSLKPNSKPKQFVKIDGGMPTALPENWEEGCIGANSGS